MIAPHQQTFDDIAKPHYGCWHGTGTGKTRTCTHSVREHEGSIMVVAPKTSVQKKQWQGEAKTLGLKEPFVISKEQFRRDHKTLPHFDAVIFDEAHFIFGVTPNTKQVNKVKVPKASQLYEAARWYIDTHKPKRVILATATPNKTPMSIWAAGRLLGRDWDFYRFRNLFYKRLPMNVRSPVYAPKRDKASIDALARFTNSLGQSLRMEDIKDVPLQSFITETFDLTAKQKETLKTLPSRFTDLTSLRCKRHQVENGLLYEDALDPVAQKVVRTVENIPCEKLAYIIERSYEFPKMVIFANYTEQVDQIAEALRKEGKEVHVMDSRTKDRKAVENAVESVDSAYVVAQATVSSEWEFKSCPVMIFASLSNKNVDYIQGKGRIQRYDAVKKNLYIHLVTDHKESIDKRWYDAIMSGKDFNEALYE